MEIMRLLVSGITSPVFADSGLSLGSAFNLWCVIRKAATGPPIKEPMIFPQVPAATPMVVALGAPHSSKIAPKADAVPTPPDMDAEEH